MVSAKVRLTNSMGLHLRPAQFLIREITPYGCDVTITYNGRVINAKSIMNLLSACIKQGSEIEIKCNGENEEECLKAALALIESGLGE